jgi:hypothetical protein
VKVAVELLVFPLLVLVKFKVWELYAVSRGIGLGGAPVDDELVVHENVVVEVEVDELVDFDELVDAEVEAEADEEAVIAELDALMAELAEEEADVDELLLLSARYAAAPPTTSTTITIAAITA